ncbi:MAG: aldo/keto reductase [Phycisphaeraceae bacterium]
MNTRDLYARGPQVTECGLGCWQLGGGWGNPFSTETAHEILDTAYTRGIRFYDTADVYGGGESERCVGSFRQSHPDIFVATKLGRRGLYPDNYTRETLREATQRSLESLGVNRIDLTQLHCLPENVLREGKVFDWLREQQDEGLISGFGASVETVSEGLVCLEQEGLKTLQVIFNILRQKPLEELLPKAQEKGVGIIVRLPLASGLLTGKFTRDTQFREGDHRHAHLHGEHPESFGGIPFEKGVELADELKTMVPEGMTMVQMALRWVLDHDAVSVVIPGASSPEQARANAAASELPPLPDELHQQLATFYREKVHEHIRGPY